MEKVSLRWRVSYDGESDYEGTVDGRPIRICVRFDKSYRPERNRQDVNAPGTAYIYCRCETLPSPEIMAEIMRVRRCGEPTHDRWCNPVCCSHTEIRPVRYDKDRGMFVDANGLPAHCALVEGADFAEGGES